MAIELTNERPSSQCCLREALRDAVPAFRKSAADEKPLVQKHELPLIVKLFGNSPQQAPPREDIVELQAKIKRHWQLEGRFSPLSPYEWRQSPWVFFMQLDGGPVLGEIPELMTVYTRVLRERGTSRAISALVHAFLDKYPTSWATFPEWRKFIRQIVRTRETTRIEAWRVRDNSTDLLGEQGPAKLAHDLLASANFDTVLANRGLDSLLSNAGFVEAAYAVMISTVARLISREDVITQLQNLLSFSMGNTGLRFDGQRAVLANGLLEPLADRDGAAEVSHLLSDFFLTQFGDPRLDRSRWMGVSDKALSTIKRWLVHGTLTDFFQLIDQTALDSQWRFRHAFWLAYYQRGAIDDAWVALGRNARKRAHRASNELLLTHGRLRDAGPDASILLLRIESLIILEWSHAGACRIYESHEKNTPRLYSGIYSGQSLRQRQGIEHIIHAGSERGAWQERLAYVIEERTGIKVTASDYMPHKGRG